MKKYVLQCKIAGQEPQCIEFDKHKLYICKLCSGKITVITRIENGREKIVLKQLESNTMGLIPMKYHCEYDCPATLPDPRTSPLVKVIEVKEES